MPDNPFVCPECGEELVLRQFYGGFEDHLIEPDGSMRSESFDSYEEDEGEPQVWCPNCCFEVADFCWDGKAGKVVREGETRKKKERDER